MFKFFHALRGRRNSIQLNKKLDNLGCEPVVKGRKSKKKFKEGEKKSANSCYEPSRAEFTPEELVSPSMDNCFPLSDSPDLTHKPRKSFDNIFKYSGRSRKASKLSSVFTDDFWERHFSGQQFVPWEEFRASFLMDYGALIDNFAPERTHWILAVVHEDIFRDMDKVYWCYYDKFCKQHEADGDRLWLSVKKYASERIFREGVVESMFE